jgi:hypothetical protein
MRTPRTAEGLRRVALNHSAIAALLSGVKSCDIKPVSRKVMRRMLFVYDPEAQMFDSHSANDKQNRLALAMAWQYRTPTREAITRMLHLPRPGDRVLFTERWRPIRSERPASFFNSAPVWQVEYEDGLRVSATRDMTRNWNEHRPCGSYRWRDAIFLPSALCRAEGVVSCVELVPVLSPETAARQILNGQFSDTPGVPQFTKEWAMRFRQSGIRLSDRPMAWAVWFTEVARRDGTSVACKGSGP